MVPPVAEMGEMSPVGLAVAHEQTTLTVKGNVVATAAQARGRGAIDAEACRKFEAFVEKDRGGDSGAKSDIQSE
jgi:hypothetical protein